MRLLDVVGVSLLESTTSSSTLATMAIITSNIILHLSSLLSLVGLVTTESYRRAESALIFILVGVLACVCGDANIVN